MKKTLMLRMVQRLRGYRLLRGSELVQKGDEWWDTWRQGWVPCTKAWGCVEPPYVPTEGTCYRRPTALRKWLNVPTERHDDASH